MGREMPMSRVFAVLMLTLTIGSPRFATAGQRDDQQVPVTIQIHDYWHVSDESLTRARAIVTAMYDRVGVRVEWTGVVQQSERRAGSRPHGSPSRLPVAQVTVIILTPTMAARVRVEEGALGFAAVPEEGMGRIAYAIYDRIKDTAARAAMNEDDLLGFAMAHEIAHLLLPRGAHSDSGIMRGHWNVEDLRRVDVLKLEFSAQQASEIRTTLMRNSPAVAANVANAAVR